MLTNKVKSTIRGYTMADLNKADMVLECDENELYDMMFGMGNSGMCLACGNVQGGCKPDAHNYLCEECGEHEVMGMQDAVLTGHAILRD